MVLLRQSSANLSPGLLPTPSSPPSKDLQPISYVASSCHPIPFPAVVLLEGCPILDVLSWSLNVSSKTLKLKITWSCSLNSSSVNVFNDIFPTNILSTLNLYNISRPNWSSSSSSSPKPSISLSIDWQLQPCVSPINSPTSTPSGSPSKSYPPSSFYTPISKRFNNSIDSGFGSSARCHGSSSNNWRNTSPPSQPKFDSPARTRPRNHDVFVPEPKPTSPSSPKLPCVSSKVSQPSIISKTKSVDLPSKPQPDLPVPFRPRNHDVFVPKPKSTSPSSPKPPNPPCVSLEVSKPTIIKTNSVDLPSKPQPDLPTSSQTSACNNLSTIPELVPPPTAFVDYNSYDSSSSISDSELDGPTTKSKYDFLGSILRPTPSRLMVDNNGFIQDEIEAYFMIIPGRCRLCSFPTSSYLIDLHLLECPKLNRNPIENFLDVISPQLNIKRDVLLLSAKDFAAFLLSEHYIPNKQFANISDFHLFTSNLEMTIEELACEAKDILCLRPNFDNFHILNYSAVNK